MLKFFFLIYVVKIFQVKILKELKDLFECFFMGQRENFCGL